MQTGASDVSTWLERLVAKTRIPYQLFFVLEGFLLYGVGLILAGLTGNLQEFISDPKWVYFIALQAFAGAMIIYSLHRFDSSLDRLKAVIALSEEQYDEAKRRLRKSVTMPLYWFLAVFLLGWYLACIYFVGNGPLDWGDWSSQWVWWATYNSPSTFYLYYEIICLPWLVLASMYLWVVAVGLNLAYAKLCFRTPFRGTPLLTLGTRLFDGFARLTIITFVCLVVASLSYLYLWNPMKPQIWGPSLYLPIGAIYTLVMALPAAFLPHYCFYKLFSRTKNGVLSNIESQIMTLISKGTTTSGKKQERQLAVLHQSKVAVESARTSLLHVRIVVEFVFVSFGHLALMQLVPHLE